MKRMMFIAAAFAALVCCSKSETSQNPSTEPGTEETPAVVEYAFTEGETVTITAGASLTKVTSALNDKNGVDFKWESGDTIKVMVDNKSSVFKVSKLKDGGVNAEFTGRMPASGNNFDVQYPVTYPDLTSQTYSSTEAIPHDAMKFTATGCTVDKPFTLEAVYAALRLNFWGTNQTVGKIVVTNTISTDDPKPSYTLNMDSPVTIGSTRTDSTSFFIVVPAGEWKFSAEIFDGTSASICSFETSSAKTFEANQILNMSAKEVKKAEPVFSVSATKTVKFTKGNLWCNTTTTPVEWHLEESQTAYPTEWSADHVGHFFWTKDAANSYAASFSDGPYATSDHFFADGSDADHSLTIEGQSGLYALSKDEWTYLLSSTGRGDGDSKFKKGVTVNGIANCLVIAPDGYTGTIASSYSAEKWATAEASGLVCLPAAGHRYGSSLYDGGSKGRYWSATPYGFSESRAYFLYFVDSNVSPSGDYYRNYGYSVRLVWSVVSE